MKLPRKIPVVLILLFCVAFKPFHHGWANYDQDKTLDFKATIQESLYENPHASVKVKQDDKVWLVILAPVTRMTARGVKADMLKKGATIQVVGYPHKEVKDEMRAERIFVNGQKYELR
ncbi:MAG: hypothetical protein JWQ40_435 [Segetibacter sp.]|jgi:hypothetical protein|nr:hypothetical protein [Segetibacter sp.]